MREKPRPSGVHVARLIAPACATHIHTGGAGQRQPQRGAEVKQDDRGQSPSWRLDGPHDV
eukprot:363761-Chlamydomonas_euryale.AAC.21